MRTAQPYADHDIVVQRGVTERTCTKQTSSQQEKHVEMKSSPIAAEKKKE
jgi:hypothetical protein